MANIGIDIRMIGNRNGGIGRYVLELVKNVLAQDNSNQYVLFYHAKLSDMADVDGFKKYGNVELVETKARHYSLGEQTKFAYQLQKQKLDLVHFPNFNVPMLYKKPFVVTIHDLVHHKIGGAKKSNLLHFFAYKKVIEAAARDASAIITVSEYSKKEIVKYLHVPQEKICLTYEGVSISEVIPDGKVAAVKKKFLLNRPYFLFVGVLERKKNVVNLTRGFDAFLKKYRLDMDLVVAGPADPHYPDIKFEALDITHRDHLVFTGYAEDEDLAGLYKGAYAFASASLHEGFGLPGVEAMQFGLPLVVSDTPVFNEIYGDAAIYFNPLDPDDIAEKLFLLARDPQFYDQRRQNSFRQGQKFDWEKTAEQTLAIYQRVISANIN